MNPARWSRRSALTLGLTALVVLTCPPGAEAADVTVGDLTFVVPGTVASASVPTVYGDGWQWAGGSGPGPLPGVLVLARSDLDSADAAETLGLLLAGSAGGLLPRVAIQPLPERTMPGGGQQTRVDVSYAVGVDRSYHGTLLIAVRNGRPTALLAVLGDDTLTAGAIDAVLSSARWRR